ncbi:hypothetical protein SDC9_95800 [bioreactor metagenome]|uniref:DUF1559 domain-containing protein n=1 Tax=bioreactor metagenome TaxID=1076179 RepID=A0A645A7I0_9ZZZZ
MLLPALSAARERARSASCINKLKQIGVAEMMYSTTNKDLIAVDVQKNYDIANTVTNGNLMTSNYPAFILVEGGYFGVDRPTSTIETQEQCERFYKCPSDTSNFTATTISYNYYVWKKAHSGWGTPEVAARFIIGRDNPGAMTWADCIWTTAPNHAVGANLLHLGGHVRGINSKPSDTVALAWGDRYRKVLDDISY